MGRERGKGDMKVEGGRKGEGKGTGGKGEGKGKVKSKGTVSYTHLRAHET